LSEDSQTAKLCLSIKGFWGFDRLAVLLISGNGAPGANKSSFVTLAFATEALIWIQTFV
jgi:hypothetical protein